MYAQVLIEYPTKKIDKYFTYKVPKHLEHLKRGMKVKVPFNNRVINGFVMSLINEYKEDFALKEIVDIELEELVLTDELMDLGVFIKEKTLCPLISAYQAMLPSSMKIKNITSNYNKYNTYLVLNKNVDDIKTYIDNNTRSIKQNELLKDIIKNEKVEKKIYPAYLVKALIEKELIKEEKVQVYRINKSKDDLTNKKVLNEEQLVAYNTIINTSGYETYLLEGVTGSGKTEVYLNVINHYINNGKTAIILVPEISLTMQIINRFYEWFGDEVAVFHSGLSSGEKYDEYLKILRGEVSVVIGTRSAIFVPLKNIGIIIIDEEHSDTFKQDNTPRYHAIEVAKERAKYHNCALLLGSATPSLETKARALKNVYKHLVLTKRAGGSILPNVEIVSMLEEVKKRNFIFSESLKDKMEKALNNEEQIIILLNRRGYSTTITCSCCGFTYKCPNCDITLTYHKSTNNLRCHYCGYAIKKDDTCPECHEESLTYLGLGTEKVEIELQKLFPTSRIVRMDQDTTSKKGMHEKIISDFKDNKYDILLGTQMISKGLDFPMVTLVGILNADSSLNIPDFRSNEKTFSLLYQASGRAGRREVPGNVVIQTFNSDNYVLKCVQEQNFSAFYDYEMNIRRILKYPPYYYLVGIKIISKDYDMALKHANDIAKYLKSNIEKESVILGPTTATLFKHNNYYRFQIVVKYRFDDKLMSALKEIDNKYLNELNVQVEIDIDPSHI